jgi:hypothetical protein
MVETWWRNDEEEGCVCEELEEGKMAEREMIWAAQRRG